MERDIPSKLDTGYLDQMMSSLKTWPTWFHSDRTADEVDFRGDPYPKAQQKVESRGLIRLGMKSPRWTLGAGEASGLGQTERAKPGPGTSRTAKSRRRPRRTERRTASELA